MQKSNKKTIFDFCTKLFGSTLTRKAHNLYKRIINRDSRFEIDLIENSLQYVGSGAIVFDIGANIGRWAIPLSKNVGDKGKIYAFEPNKETFAFLKRRVQPYSNIVINEVALSDGIKEEHDFLVQKGISCPPNAAIVDTATQIKNKANFEIISIQSQSMDSFTEEQNIKSIDFIKIDVEGHELQVLKGFKKGIKKFQPTFAIEILRDKWEQNASDSEVARLILDEGYKMAQFNEVSNTYEFDQNKFAPEFLNYLFVK